MPQPLLRLESVATAYGTAYRITGHTYAPSMAGLTLHSELTVNDYGGPTHIIRHQISQWLREFADSYERGAAESDKQKIAKLEQQLDEARTTTELREKQLRFVEQKVDNALEALGE